MRYPPPATPCADTSGKANRVSFANRNWRTKSKLGPDDFFQVDASNATGDCVEFMSHEQAQQVTQENDDADFEISKVRPDAGDAPMSSTDLAALIETRQDLGWLVSK